MGKSWDLNVYKKVNIYIYIFWLQHMLQYPQLSKCHLLNVCTPSGIEVVVKPRLILILIQNHKIAFSKSARKFLYDSFLIHFWRQIPKFCGFIRCSAYLFRERIFKFCIRLGSPQIVWKLKSRCCDFHKKSKIGASTFKNEKGDRKSIKKIGGNVLSWFWGIPESETKSTTFFNTVIFHAFFRLLWYLTWFIVKEMKA